MGKLGSIRLAIFMLFGNFEFTSNDKCDRSDILSFLTPLTNVTLVFAYPAEITFAFTSSYIAEVVSTLYAEKDFVMPLSPNV